MSLNLILASGNKHKASEFNELFDSELVLIQAASVVLNVVEDGDSYTQNAFLKAKAYYDKFQTAVLADDSGLNVDAMPGELGIHSARFGGDGLTDAQRTSLLIEKMKEIPEEERGASFSCVLCFYLSPEEVYFFEGKLKGKIGDRPVGSDGFGYDPVFLPEALVRGGEMKTVAEASEWKKLNSHRALAVREAQAFFKERRGQI